MAKLISQISYECSQSVKQDEIILTEDLRLRFSQGVKITLRSVQKSRVTDHQLNGTNHEMSHVVSTWVYGNDAVSYLSNYFRDNHDHDATEYATHYTLELVYEQDSREVELNLKDGTTKTVNRKTVVLHEKETRNGGKIESTGFKSSTGNCLPVYSGTVSEVILLPKVDKIDLSKLQDPRISSKQSRLKKHAERLASVQITELKRDRAYPKFTNARSLFAKNKVKIKMNCGNRSGSVRDLDMVTRDNARYKDGYFELSLSGCFVYYIPDKGYLSIAGIIVQRGQGLTMTMGSNPDLYHAALKYIGHSLDIFNKTRYTTLESSKIGTKGIIKEVVSYIPSTYRTRSIQDRLSPYIPFDDSHLLNVVKAVGENRIQYLRKHKAIAKCEQKYHKDPTDKNLKNLEIERNRPLSYYK